MHSSTIRLHGQMPSWAEVACAEATGQNGIPLDEQLGQAATHDTGGTPMRIRLPLARMEKRFTGEWSDRLNGLFSCGVDFAGRSILDLGCNMGIVAYEIAKHGPVSIHGVDQNRQHIQIARSIFQAVPVESRFDCMSIASRRFQATA